MGRHDKKYVDGHLATGVTDDKCRSLGGFSIRNSTYARLLCRYLCQFQMINDAIKNGGAPVRVLDVGCASGTAAHLYASAAMQSPGRAGIAYEGVDVDPDVVAKANAETPTGCVWSYSCREADVALPWDWAHEHGYDVVWCTETLEHVVPEQALQVLVNARLHRAGDWTRMLLTMPAPLGDEMVWPDSHDHEWKREDARQLFSDSGWTIVDEWGMHTERKLLCSTDESKSVYETLRKRVGTSIAQACVGALYPDLCDGLAWMLK